MILSGMIYMWRKKRLSTKAKGITGILNLIGDSSGYIIGDMTNGKQHQSPYIDKFGLINMARYLTAWSYTTKTTILLITKYRTWGLSLVLSINDTTLAYQKMLQKLAKLSKLLVEQDGLVLDKSNISYKVKV